MRRFDSIVMQETEPVEEGTLWLRQEHNIINNEEEVVPVGMNFWWFGANGWVPLNERYSYNTTFDNKAVSSNPINVEISPDEKTGIISVETCYSMYDGTRDIGNNGNFVNEKALKKHVDELQTQINNLKNRVSTLEGKVSSLETIVDNHITTLSSHTTSISNLNNRVSLLESSIN